MTLKVSMEAMEVQKSLKSFIFLEIEEDIASVASSKSESIQSAKSNRSVKSNVSSKVKPASANNTPKP